MKKTALWSVISLGCVCVPILLTGCSRNAIGKTDLARGVYSHDDVEKFAKETRSLPPGFAEPVYIIGVADELDVVFLFHKDLTTRSLQVRRDGKISLPYIGDQSAAGYSPMQLDSVLTGLFSEILKEPSISVIVRKMAQQKVYVLGEVPSPGVYRYDDELSVVQALAMAGGMRKSAAASNIVLIRRDGTDRIVGVEVDVKGIIRGERMQDDIRLRNYDIVYVPKRRLNSLADFMIAVDNIISPPIDATFTVWSVRNLTASYDFFNNNAGR